MAVARHVCCRPAQSALGVRFLLSNEEPNKCYMFTGCTGAVTDTDCGLSLRMILLIHTGREWQE